MTKTLGLTLALLLALTLSAAAEEAKGAIRSVDPADQSFVLEDGTRLWLSASQLADVTPGDNVLATYQVQGGKNILVEFERRARGPEGQETTNFGSGTIPVIDFQAD